MIQRIDRWNCGTLRRYHLPSKAILVCRTDRVCKVIPPFASLGLPIAVVVSRETAAQQLRATRVRQQEAGDECQ